MHLLKILVIAFSLGLDVFAVGVGVGIRGAEMALKIRIGIAFASAEVIMNVLGLALGSLAGHVLGAIAGYLGFSALVGVGGYMIFESIRESEDKAPLDMSRGWGLFIAALSISLDSLGIGFSILYIGVPIYLALAVIFVVSVLCTFAGLTLGRALGRRVEEGAELFSGVILVLTGIGFILAKIFHVG